MRYFRLLFLGGLSFLGADLVWAADQFAHVESIGRRITVSGYTRAYSTMPLVTEVEGKIRMVSADVGDAIPKDNLFACIDETFVKLDIKSAQNEMKQHTIDIDFFAKEVDRHQKLVKKNTVAISALDKHKKDLGNSRQLFQAAYINKLRFEESLRRHCIEAPAGWRVVSRDVEPGQWVNAGEKLGEVGNYTKLLIPFSLSAQELDALTHAKDQLEVKLTGYASPIPVAIDKIYPSFDEQSRKTQVDLVVLEKLTKSRGGIRAELGINVAESGHVFSISKNAVEERYEEHWLQREDGARFKVRFLGHYQDGKVKVSSTEIKLGDRFKLFH